MSNAEQIISRVVHIGGIVCTGTAVAGFIQIPPTWTPLLWPAVIVGLLRNVTQLVYGCTAGTKGAVVHGGGT